MNAKKYISEAVGVFFFTLVVLLASARTAEPLYPLLVGVAWFAVRMVWGQAGTFYGNPVFLVADLLADRVEQRMMAPYLLLSQLLGALLAVPFSALLLGCMGIYARRTVVTDPFCLFFAEMAGAFCWTLAYLRIRDAQAASAQASMLTALLFALGSLAAGLFNPVTSMALALSGSMPWIILLTVSVACLLGAAAAATLTINTQQDEDHRIN
jgi:glycerol uptake facilitator-like aquaporin